MAAMRPDFFYFSEETSMIDPKKFDYQKKSNMGTWWLEFLADMHFFGVLNRNNRGYLGDNIKKNVLSPKNCDMMKRDAWFGEDDHPFQMYNNVELTRKRIEKVVQERRSHKLTTPVFLPDRMTMILQTASATEPGRGLANDILQGLIPAFSCRSAGELVIDHGMPIVMTSKIITYDQVPFAGFAEAYMKGPAKGKSAYITEEGADAVPAVSSPSHDIMIAAKELLDDLTKDDGKMYAYMESAEGDVDAVGLTTDNALHITHDNIHIYAGLNKQSLDIVKDFYSSFGRR